MNSPWESDGTSSPQPVKGPQWFIDFFICHIKRETCSSCFFLFSSFLTRCHLPIITAFNKKRTKSPLDRANNGKFPVCVCVSVNFFLSHWVFFYMICHCFNVFTALNKIDVLFFQSLIFCLIVYSELPFLPSLCFSPLFPSPFVLLHFSCHFAPFALVNPPFLVFFFVF